MLLPACDVMVKLICACDNDSDCYINFIPFPAGYQLRAIKMVATDVAEKDSKDSIAAELVRLFKQVDYATVIRPLKVCDTIPIDQFGKMNISMWFQLDTSKCFVGKQKLEFNDQ